MQLAPVAAVVLVMALFLAGCGAPAPVAPPSSPATSTVPAATVPPEGVRIELFQQRSDYGPRRIQLAVVNDGPNDIEVLGLRLSSPYLATDAEPANFPYTVKGGTTVNFPVVLPAAACDTAARTSDPVAQLDYAGVGGPRSVRLIPTQPFDSLELVHTNECRQDAFESRVAITPGSTIRLEKDAEGKLTALLSIRLAPTGKAGRASITRIGGTILLDVQPVRRLPISFGPQSPVVTIVVRATPTRCDPHVVGEDKVGTILPVTVSVGGDSGTFSLALPATLRNQYLQFVSTACGW